MFLCAGLRKRINMYDCFIEGAKEGFKTAVMIIPYLVAILVAIGMFRASGAMEVITDFIAGCFNAIGVNADWVGALPTALMKPLSEMCIRDRCHICGNGIVGSGHGYRVD